MTTKVGPCAVRVNFKMTDLRHGAFRPKLYSFHALNRYGETAFTHTNVYDDTSKLNYSDYHNHAATTI